MTTKTANRAWPVLGATAVVLICRAALADPPTSPVVNVDCPALNEEARSAVEARLRADLAVRAIDDGSFAISCDNGGVSLRWQPRASASRQASMQVGEAGSLVDRILEIATSLLEEPEPAPPRQPVVPPSPPAVAPVAAPVAAPTASASEPPGLVAATGAGMWQLWPGQGVQMLGPSLGLQLRLGWAVSADAWAAAQWGLQRPQRFETRTLSLGLGASVFLESSRTWSLGAGGSVMQLTARAGTDLQPTSRQATVLGGWMNLLVGAPLAGFRIDVGPQVMVWAKSHTVVVDGGDAYSQPVFVPGATLRISFPAARW